MSHIYVPAQRQNWTPRWSSRPNYISHSGIPSSHPILFLASSVLSTCQGHHRIGGAADVLDSGFLADLSAYCHSNPLCLLPPPFCRWGSVVSMYIFLQFAWAKHSMEDQYYSGWHFCFLCFYSGCRYRGNWPICPGLDKFMEAGSVLGQGVSYLTWKVWALVITSSDGGLEL